MGRSPPLDVCGSNPRDLFELTDKWHHETHNNFKFPAAKVDETDTYLASFEYWQNWDILSVDLKGQEF